MTQRSKEDLIADSYLALGVDDESAEILTRYLRPDVVRLEEGMIYEAGSPASDLHVIVEDGDAVEMRFEPVEGDGERTILRHVEGIFGELEFIARSEGGRFAPRMFSAHALRPMRAVKFSFRNLLAVPSELLGLIERRLSAVAVERFRQQLEFSARTLAVPKAVSLIDLLIHLGEDFGVREGAGRRLLVKKTQMELAREVGLSREVVNIHLNQWARAGILAIGRGSISILDLERLIKLGHMQTAKTAKEHDRSLTRFDQALQSGQLLRARNLAVEALQNFPASPELLHRLALSLLRSGAPGEAEQLLSTAGYRNAGEFRGKILSGLRHPSRKPGRRAGLDVDDELDDDVDFQKREVSIARRAPPLTEDMLALSGRIAKDRAWITIDGAPDEKNLTLARDYYLAAHAATSRPYAGINAAAMMLALGEGSEAARLASKVAARLPEGATDYWSVATKAEAAAIAGDLDRASALFRSAASLPDATIASVASTRLQLKRLSPKFGECGGALLKSIPQVGVAAFSGHMMPARSLDAKAQRQNIDELIPRIKDALQQHRTAIGYGALASGSDILLAEALLKRNGAMHAVLPFRVEDFVKISVAPGIAEDGPDWQEHFSNVLAKAATLTIGISVWAGTLTRAEIDDVLRYSNRRAVGMAVINAQSIESEPVLVAIHDGNLPDSTPGTSYLIAKCRELGIPVDIVPCDWRPRKDPPAQLDERSLHRAIGFLRPSSGKWADTASSLNALVERLAPSSQIVTTADAHGENGLAVMMDDCLGAVSTLQEICEAAREKGLELQCAGDFGLVLESHGRLVRGRLSRLDAADKLLRFPSNTLVVSEAFAAEAAVEGYTKIRFGAVGTLSPSENHATAAPVPSIPFYRPLLHR